MSIPEIILEIRNFKKMGNLILSSWVRGNGTSVEVAIYFDEKTNTAYQVDEFAHQYRKAVSKDGEIAEYGDWIKV